MRGKLPVDLNDIAEERITPADAGKTSFKLYCEIPAWDHPRGCGENGILLRICLRKRGSPPRMRGKLGSSLLNKLFNRITPADAGKTIFHQSSQPHIQDHPRGCGENPRLCFGLYFQLGSPPRMRGKLLCKVFCFPLKRITPADAGKTLLSLKKSFSILDHPRGCGENILGLIMFAVGAGSPPRMRGKPDNHRCRNLVAGITPADAGKTFSLTA